MRKVFLDKLKEIQQSGYFFRKFSPPDKLIYEKPDGSLEEFELESEEHFCVKAVLDSFFLEDHRRYIPDIENDDIELEVFAHSCSTWLNQNDIQELGWFEDREIGKYLGPSSDDRFSQITYQSGYIGSYLSFLEDNSLKLISLEEGDKLKEVITGGFPLPYLSGLVKRPDQIDWNGVPEKAFSLYLKYFASPEEKKLLLIAYA